MALARPDRGSGVEECTIADGPDIVVIPKATDDVFYSRTDALKSIYYLLTYTSLRIDTGK
jgi:hypothetical protein